MSYGQDSKNYPPKSRFAFILLALFFNSLGLHSFYAGYCGTGVVHLLWNVATVYVGFQGGQYTETMLWMYGINWFVVLGEIISTDTDANNITMK